MQMIGRHNVWIRDRVPHVRSVLYRACTPESISSTSRVMWRLSTLHIVRNSEQSATRRCHSTDMRSLINGLLIPVPFALFLLGPSLWQLQLLKLQGLSEMTKVRTNETKSYTAEHSESLITTASCTTNHL